MGRGCAPSASSENLHVKVGGRGADLVPGIPGRPGRSRGRRVLIGPPAPPSPSSRSVPDRGLAARAQFWFLELRDWADLRLCEATCSDGNAAPLTGRSWRIGVFVIAFQPARRHLTRHDRRPSRDERRRPSSSACSLPILQSAPRATAFIAFLRLSLFAPVRHWARRSPCSRHRGQADGSAACKHRALNALQHIPESG